ncbi:hypothetical protein EXS71_01415 [Candidatus Uhrbacteria bacterium]|nr:hypothetical protein [Candidatus Uhrbacteria bacterium]
MITPEVTWQTVSEDIQILQANGMTVAKNLNDLTNTVHDLNGKVDDLIETLNKFSTHVDEKFYSVDQRFEKIDHQFDRMDQRFDRMEGRVGNIEKSMVTKDYLDIKLSDLRSDLTLLTSKEDRKLGTLVHELVEQGRLSPQGAKKILALEPFPQGS